LINPALAGRERVYVLLNKPRGYLASLSDPEGRPLVTELIPQSLGRLHPVGRLDFNTEGLLVLTNDGELTNFVTSARNKVAKVYEVKVKGVPPEQAIERLRRGIALDDGERTAPARIELTGETKTNAWFEVVLHEGRNQQIRRMFDAIGHSVLKLRRVRIGNLRDERLPTGAWRHLKPAEVASLKRGDASHTRTSGARGSGARSSGARASGARRDDARGKSVRDDARGGRERGARKKPARGAAKARGAGHVRG
jgi:23S rRNA pseudouridine2605 synthase